MVNGAFDARQSFCRLFVGFSMAAAIVGGASAQAAGDSEVRYSALLKEIENVKLSIAHTQSQIATQEATIESLAAQIKSVPAVKDAVPKILKQMSSEMRKQISSDVPFKLEERNDRMGAFEDSLAEDSEATVGEQMRRALSIYAIEAGYGANVEAYAGDNPIENNQGARYRACQEDISASACGLNEDQVEAIEADTPLSDLAGELRDGDYLRYGRLALVYMQHDGSEAYRYDVNSKNWESLEGVQVLEVRRAVRMAKGESSPGVITAPLYVR